MRKGDRVSTPDGPGTVVGPFLSRGLSRHGDLREDGWIVALDSGARRIYLVGVLRLIYRDPERGNE